MIIMISSNSSIIITIIINNINININNNHIIIIIIITIHGMVIHNMCIFYTITNNIARIVYNYVSHINYTHMQLLTLCVHIYIYRYT